MALIKIILILCGVIGAVICRSISTKCPEPEVIHPCICDYESKTYETLLRIQCLGDEELDLIRVFTNLSQTLKGMNKKFNEFYLNNTRITELPANVFSDIGFKMVRIEGASRLTRIHSQAFNGTQHTITSLYINATPVQNSGPDYDLFGAINTLNELMALTVSRANVSAVPDRAFGPLDKLIGINMGYGAVQRIGERAFDELSNIQFLSFYVNRITHVSMNAFSLSIPSDKTVKIALFGNRLTDESVQSGAFADIRRPVDLQLQYNKELKVLNRDVFEDIFAQNMNNNITIASINCNNCRNYWLLEKYGSKTDLIKCDNNLNLTDESNFKTCSPESEL